MHIMYMYYSCPPPTAKCLLVVQIHGTLCKNAIVPNCIAHVCVCSAADIGARSRAPSPAFRLSSSAQTTASKSRYPPASSRPDAPPMSFTSAEGPKRCCLWRFMGPGPAGWVQAFGSPSARVRPIDAHGSARYRPVGPIK